MGGKLPEPLRKKEEEEKISKGNLDEKTKKYETLRLKAGGGGGLKLMETKLPTLIHIHVHLIMDIKIVIYGFIHWTTLLIGQ